MLLRIIESDEEKGNWPCSSAFQLTAVVADSHRHRAIELGLIFMCSIDQLSPGAYFLRHDFLRATCKVRLALRKMANSLWHGYQFIRRCDDPSYSQPFLFISSLVNYHRTDAAQLNPYPAQLVELDDREVFRRALLYYTLESQKLIKYVDFIRVAAALTFEQSSYQVVYDDRTPTLYATLSGFFGQLKPDRVLAPATAEAPSAQFINMFSFPLFTKDILILYARPPPNAIFLVSMYDLMIYNEIFLSECAESDPASTFGPILSAFSYLATNAWSPSNKRASTYSRISLNILLLLAENQQTFEMLYNSSTSIHICKQVSVRITL